MSGGRVALDTSIAIAVLAGDSHLVASLQDVSEFCLPVPVVGELRYGALNSQRSAENLLEVERLVARCQVLDVTIATAEVYARLRMALKEKGRPIPENDLWIAAVCVQHGAPLAASDGHFDAIDELPRRSVPQGLPRTKGATDIDKPAT